MKSGPNGEDEEGDQESYSLNALETVFKDEFETEESD